jgi:hypothetical protein
MPIPMIITRRTSGFHYFCSFTYRCWQHARGLRLVLAFIYLTLATYSGAAPRIGIHLPDIGNTLKGGASQPNASNMLGGYTYMLTLAFAPLAPGVGNTLGTAPCILLTSAVLYMAYCILSSIPSTTSSPVRTVDSFRLDADDFTPCRLYSAVFDSCHPHASDTNLFAYNDQTLGGSTMTLPLIISGTASARLHHHGDSDTMGLHRRNDSAAVSTSFCVLSHDMQDCGFKARFESLPDSTTRLDTRGLLTRERPLVSSSLVYLVPAQEEAHSKNT